MRLTIRGLGALLLVQLLGLIVPFVLLLPIAADWRTVLANLPSSAPQVRWAVAWLYANGALAVWVSLALFERTRRSSGVLALGFVLAAAGVLGLQAVDNSHVLALITLERGVAATTAGAMDPPTVELVMRAALAARRWSHNSAILAIDVWMVLLYVVAARVLSAPRWLMVVGLATVGLHAVGIPLRTLAGMPPLGELGMPMAVSQLALATWCVGWGTRQKRDAAQP